MHGHLGGGVNNLVDNFFPFGSSFFACVVAFPNALFVPGSVDGCLFDLSYYCVEDFFEF